ncbi:MAG: agmatinase family protein [Deltaproteobacteria bacterium]|nr:agmatinase family protein [Deltaproteobacteria bacterium]
MLSKEKLRDIEKAGRAEDRSAFLGTAIGQSEADLVLLPVPWDATTSYGGGAAEGPDAIVEASQQLDLEDLCFDRPYQVGILMAGKSEGIVKRNIEAASFAKKSRVSDPVDADAIAGVNRLSAWVNEYVYGESGALLKSGKMVGVVGGDHSSPYGFIKALCEHIPKFGILHIDAHLDLRQAYEGFQWSHASIMRNVLQDFPGVEALVSVGIRDVSREEWDVCVAHKERIKVFPDRDLSRRNMHGAIFETIVGEILSYLPENVYISFDVDGLDQRFCPGTGTPVPGGLEYHEAVYLLEELALSGRKIVGFDLSEVARGGGGGEWDGNVGARLLYKLCGAMAFSQGKMGRSPRF